MEEINKLTTPKKTSFLSKAVKQASKIIAPETGESKNKYYAVTENQKGILKHLEIIMEYMQDKSKQNVESVLLSTVSIVSKTDTLYYFNLVAHECQGTKQMLSSMQFNEVLNTVNYLSKFYAKEPDISEMEPIHGTAAEVGIPVSYTHLTLPTISSV